MTLSLGAVLRAIGGVMVALGLFRLVSGGGGSLTRTFDIAMCLIGSALLIFGYFRDRS